jgi:hypothetical protein
MRSKTTQRIITSVSNDIHLRCKADAAALGISLSGYVETVLRARFGLLTMNPPVKPVELAGPSHGTGRSWPAGGGAYRTAGSVYDPLGLESPPETDDSDPFGGFTRKRTP